MFLAPMRVPSVQPVSLPARVTCELGAGLKKICRPTLTEVSAGILQRGLPGLLQQFTEEPFDEQRFVLEGHGRCVH